MIFSINVPFITHRKHRKQNFKMNIDSTQEQPTVIDCSEPWFSYILHGVKLVEGRKGTPKWAAIVEGNYLLFRNGDLSFLAVVTGVKKYKTLKEYLLVEGVSNVLPGVESFEDGLATYMQWSTPAEIEKYGFLGIHVKVLE